MFDTNILNRQTQPNVLASYLGGMEAGQQVNDQRQRNALAQYASQNGAAIMRGDQSALEGLSGFGLQGLELAQNQQGIQLDREATRLGMDATRQNMDVQRQTQARLDRAEARQIREALQQADAAAIAEERDVIESKFGALMAAYSSGDRQGFEGLVSQWGMDRDPNDNVTWDNFMAKAGEFSDVIDIYTEEAMKKAQQGTSYIATGESAAALGLPSEGAYNITAGPDGMKASAIGGGGTNVTVNNAGANPMPGLSRLGEGMTYLYNPDGTVKVNEQGAPIAVPIEGTDRAEDRASAERANQLAQENKANAANIVLEDIGRVKDMLQGGRNQPVTGIAGTVAATAPGSEAADARELTETIKANIGFDRLQQMRESSPTGGALGQVTERELATLQAVLGSLQFSQSKDQLLYNLERLEAVYSGIVEKASRTGDGSWVPRNGGQASEVSDDDLLRMYGGE